MPKFLANSATKILGDRSEKSIVVRYWPALLIGTVWLWMFWPMISGQTVVGFRDSAYFYYPYFKWIDQQWASSEIPLWNPWCDLGHPVVADGTSSVFYPGKLIFLLRFLTFPTRYGIYIASHVLLAAIGAYWCTRRLGANSFGATLAATSYAFGGSVLFQTTNVIYLVSAAWLPFALANLWMMFRVRSTHCAVRTGVSCALMILGGDPQMAYLVGLIAVGLLLGIAIRIGGKSGRAAGLYNRLAVWKFLLLGSRQLAILGCVAFVLSAIQILPTCVWAGQSVRQFQSKNIWHSLERPPPGSPAEAVYQFSQPPWSMAEMLWPNVLGKNYPLDQRWGDKLPGADRIWTPSLYVGLLTFLLALSAMRIAGRQRRRVWLTHLMIFFALASFGWYGAVWLWNEFAVFSGLSQITTLDQPVGGVYWLLATLLPGFDLFRYPAKLFVVASLALCVLAGLRMSSMAHSRSAAVSIWPAVAVLLVSALVSCVWPLTGSIKRDWLQSNPTMFGPFDFDGARTAMLWTLLHTVIVAGLICVFLVLSRRSTSSRGPSMLPMFTVLATVFELLIANSWLVPQVDQQVLEQKAQYESGSSGVESECVAGAVRVMRHPVPPDVFYTTQSQNRLEQIIDWQLESLHPKHNLTVPVGVVGSFSSIESPANTEFTIDMKNRQSDTPPSQLDAAQTVPLFVVVSAQQLATIEMDEVSALSLLADAQNSNRKHDIYVSHCTGNTLQLHCSSPECVSVFLSMLPCSGWEVAVTDRKTGQEFENCQIDGGKYFLAAQVPAGNMLVEFKYNPLEFWLGFWISLISWLILMAGMFLSAARIKLPGKWIESVIPSRD